MNRTVRIARYRASQNRNRHKKTFRVANLHAEHEVNAQAQRASNCGAKSV